MSHFTTVITSGSLPPDVPTSFVTDSGTVIAALGVVNVNGDDGLEVIANPDGSNNMLIRLTDVANSYVNVTSAMSPYTVTATDYYISIDATGGNVTINLPDTTTNYRQFIIKDRLGQGAINVITIKSLTGASTVDGQASYIFGDAYESLECLWAPNNYEGF